MPDDYVRPIGLSVVFAVFIIVIPLSLGCESPQITEKQCQKMQSDYIKYGEAFMPPLCFFVAFRSFNGKWFWSEDKKSKNDKSIGTSELK